MMLDYARLVYLAQLAAKRPPSSIAVHDTPGMPFPYAPQRLQLTTPGTQIRPGDRSTYSEAFIDGR
jgi:hypothetical protein